MINVIRKGVSMSVVTLNGSPIKTIGQLPSVGSHAPEFTLTKTDLSEVHLKNYHGRTIILNIFPSLDTPTCATAMLRFNEIASKVSNSLVLCISHDLPFAQKRFCSTQHLSNVQPVSVFRHPDFGESYGVKIIEGPLTGLLARAVVLIDPNGLIDYTEQVTELTSEPNYKKLLTHLDIALDNQHSTT
jgi:thiol peroxidase